MQIGIYLAYIITCLFIIIVTLYFALKLTAKIFTKLKFFYSQLSGDLLTKLISFSLAGFFIPFVVPTFINSIFRFFYSFFTYFLREITYFSDGLPEYCRLYGNESESEIVECVRYSINAVIQSFNNSFTKGFQDANIFGFPWLKFILFFSLWILLTEIINSIRSSYNRDGRQVTDSQSESWLQGLFKNSVATNNIIFFVILAMGLYLSFASIAAIPSLQGSQVTPEEVSVRRIETRLTNSLNQFKRRYPLKGDDYNPDFNPFVQIRSEQVDPFLELKQHFEDIQASIDAFENEKLIEIIKNNPEIISDLPESEKMLASANGESDLFRKNHDSIKEAVFSEITRFITYLRLQIEEREQIFELTDDLLLGAHREIQEKLRTAITEYESENLNRKGSRETIEHFSDIVDWFDSVVVEMESQLDNCVTSIQDADQIWRFRSLILRRSLGAFERDFRNNLESPEDYKFLNYRRYLDDYNNLSSSRNERDRNTTLNRPFRTCRFVSFSDVQKIPSRPQLGSNLGIFGFLVSWLLLTESLPLTLITGLLGFGLLGSACSSFIRESIRDSDSSSPNNLPEILARKPLVQDLPKVIIIGLSAAIVAFLSVVGGLSIFFTGNGDEANPYAILLVCLIAAVFGEDIWERTREEFNRKRSNQNNTEQQESSEIPEDDNS